MYSPDLLPDKTSAGNYVNSPYQSWNLVSPYAKSSHILAIVVTQNQTATQEDWQNGLDATALASMWNEQTASISWWHSYWDRSHIIINEAAE